MYILDPTANQSDPVQKDVEDNVEDNIEEKTEKTVLKEGGQSEIDDMSESDETSEN